MQCDISPAEVLAYSFVPDEEMWAGDGDSGLGPCVADLLHAVRRQAVPYGDNLVICSLIAITVEMAAANNDNFRVALMLRNCARILEIEGKYK